MGFIPLVLAACTLLLCCSNDDGNQTECFQNENRKVVATFDKVVGAVVEPGDEGCPTAHTIVGGPEHPQRFAPNLLPCNLPDEFKKDGLKMALSEKWEEIPIRAN